MPRIYVKFSGLDQIGSRCKVVASKVDTIQSDLQRTVQQLDWDIRFESNINSTATQIARKLEQYSRALEAYQRFIEDARNKYFKLDEYKKPTFISSGTQQSVSNYQKLVDFDITALFLDYRNTTVDRIAIGWTSDWFQNFTSLFGIGENVNEIAMRKSIESVIKEVLENKHKTSDFYSEYTDALMPEEVELSKKIIDLFVDTGETYTEVELAKILDIDIKEITESDYLKWLCQSENQQFLNKISVDMKNSIGAYADAVKTLEVSSELLTKVFNNYTEDVRYLEAIKQALVDGGYENKTVNDVVDSMLWEYRNQYISAAHDGIEELTEMGIDKGFDKLLDLAGPEASLLVNVFLDGKDITSQVIGLSEKSDNVASVYATQQYSYALVEKYEFYREKINSGIYVQSDIEQCNTYFQLAKAAKLQEYNAIKETLEDSLNSVSALFRSNEDIEYTRGIVTKIDSEIQRLESLTS